jgi:hypothetical protein
MTGEKNRYKTSEQLWKFADETLTTPAHDDLVCLLLDPQFAKDFVDYIVINRKGYNKDMITYETAIDDFKSEIWDKCSYKDSTHQMSNQIRLRKFDEDRSGCIGGGDDIERYKYYLDFARRIVSSKWPESIKKITDILEDVKLIDISTEVPISGGNGFINAYWDIVLTLNKYPNTKIYDYIGDSGPFVVKHVMRGGFRGKIINSVYRDDSRIQNTDECKIFVEIKPSIRSFGETIRQINSYIQWTKLAGKGDNIVLFTPDMRFKAQFESQGIMVISPDDVFKFGESGAT